MKLFDILNFNFRIVEDNKIDIEEIDTTKTFDYTMGQVFEWNNEMEEKINQLIRLAKQHDREIKELKENN